MKKIEITKKRARRIAVYSSRLSHHVNRPKGKKGILKVIDHLGYIQIDTISVVERAHHHTLWNRKHEYTQNDLDSLLSEDREVFEYWGHAASVLPMKDYRFYLPYMKKCRNPSSGWVLRRKETCMDILEDVFNRIREEGPLSSRDFQTETRKKQTGWWDWKPAKTALEVLFSEGRIMVSSRKGFQRYYDLTERVLPSGVNRQHPSELDTGCFYVRRALKAYGVASDKEMCDHIYSADKRVVLEALSAMTDSGEVIPVRVKSLEKVNYYILKDSCDTFLKFKKIKPVVRFLSPFDNLVIQRERIERLFDFSYRIECYVPEKKRKYGYFSLPVLYGDNLIGRMDSKADRKTKTFIVKNLLFEENVTHTKDLKKDLFSALNRFKQFNGCSGLDIRQVKPESALKFNGDTTP